METYISDSLVLSSIAVLINYCLGLSGPRFNPNEFLSWWTVLLSKRRLKNLGLLEEHEKLYNQSVIKINSRPEILRLRRDYKVMLYESAQEFFTWEKALGMCQVCTGFWISIAGAFLLEKDFLSISTIVLISHVFTRLLNKIL